MKPQMNRILVAYAALVSTGAAVALATQVTAGTEVQAFDEIDVKRINLREDDGTLRLVISNTSRFPGIIFRGKEQPHPNRRTAGMLFFNEEGTENGGLIFGGKTENGKVTSSGHLSFDQYEQDQVIQLTQQEAEGRRSAALKISDRPDKPLDFAALAKYTAMSEGPEKETELKRLSETFGGQTRIQVGKGADRSSAVALHDAAGRPRMLLQVTAEGAASIQFLDENAKVVRTLAPTATP